MFVPLDQQGSKIIPLVSVWQAFYEVAAMFNAEVKLQRDNSYQLVFLLNTPLEF